MHDRMRRRTLIGMSAPDSGMSRRFGYVGVGYPRRVRLEALLSRGERFSVIVSGDDDPSERPSGKIEHAP
jgi:hypothetical protein